MLLLQREHALARSSVFGRQEGIFAPLVHHEVLLVGREPELERLLRRNGVENRGTAMLTLMKSSSSAIARSSVRREGVLGLLGQPDDERTDRPQSVRSLGAREGPAFTSFAR